MSQVVSPAHHPDHVGLHHCRDCDQWKADSEFYRARGKNGYSPRPMCRCKKCYCNRTRAENRKRYKTSAKFRAQIYAGRRRRELRVKFGLTEADYETMLAAQRGGCAICGSAVSHHTNGRPCRLAVDHDHATGRVRSLLCSRCNQLLGVVNDRPELLEAAAGYLRHHAAEAEATTEVDGQAEGQGLAEAA